MSLIEMLELGNFGHMDTCTIQLKSHDRILLVTSLSGIMTSWPLFQNIIILIRPRLAIFADIIKIITRVIQIIFKDSIKVKRIRKYVPKCNLYLYFLI